MNCFLLWVICFAVIFFFCGDGFACRTCVAANVLRCNVCLKFATTTAAAAAAASSATVGELRPRLKRLLHFASRCLRSLRWLCLSARVVLFIHSLLSSFAVLSFALTFVLFVVVVRRLDNCAKPSRGSSSSATGQRERPSSATASRVHSTWR